MYRVNRNKYYETISKILLTLLVTLVIAACGPGGGGGDDDDDDDDDEGSVSGRLVVPSFVVTDSDVNDTKTSANANQPFSAAQVVSNPVNIGGYVNVAGSGENGNSFTNGDPQDYYQVDLTAGQTLLLNISDLDKADLDLHLYDENEAIVDSSVGTSKFESLVAPADGRYYIVVEAYVGASNYLLSIGLTAASALPPGALRLSDPFVSGDALVKFDSSTKIQAKSMDQTLSHFSFDSSARDVTGVQRLRLNQNRMTVAARFQTNASLSKDDQLKLETLMAIKELQKRSDVVYAEPNYIYQPLAVPNDEYYSFQWHYPQINLPETWDITTGSSNVIVSVIDSGILHDHPDVPAQLVDGYDFITSTERSRDGDGRDNNPEDIGDLAMSTRSSFHGTHVAGTVAANSNNSIGVAGVAWDIKIMPLRALGRGGGDSEDIRQAVLYSAGLENQTGIVPAQRADVINMSLGGGPSSQAMQDAVTAARNAGVIVIASAGNDGVSKLMYPASYAGVVSVSAVDINQSLAPYSNFGTAIDVAAPGGNIKEDVNGDGKVDGVLSTSGDDSASPTEYTYVFFNGTSMAAPHMAGVAALMKSVYPDLTPAEFDSMLEAGELTTDIGDAGRDDNYGHGLINAYKAVVAAQQRAGGGAPADPILTVNPRSLNFSSTLQTATLHIEEIGGNVGNVEITENIAWLTVTADQVNESGIGSYTATVDRTDLTPATYSGEFRVTAGDSSVDVNVIMQVTDAAASGNAGKHYVLLINSDTDETIEQVIVDAEGEDANFSFSDVPDGNYTLLAGSDMDMDGYICDAGESCGRYPTLSQPQVINVDSESVRGIDFTTSYVFQSPSGASTDGQDSDNRDNLIYHRLDRE
jgi:serine protease